MAARLAQLALLAAGTSGLRVFRPSSITIRRQIGQLGFATETEWQYYGGRRNPLDASTPARTVEASGISVRLFDAALADGSRALLKEYLGDEARAIGQRELDIYEHLDAGGGFAKLDVGFLSGYMQSDAAFETPGFVTSWVASFGAAVPPPAAGNLWLVFRWEGLRTVGGFARAEQTPEPWDGLLRGGILGGGLLGGGLFGGLGGGGRPPTARREWVRSVSRGSLRALAGLHARGVAHRSLGSSSLLVSTHDQREHANLGVKLIDFGFAASAALLDAEETAAAMRQVSSNPMDVLPLLTLYDLHGLGYVLLELVLASLSSPPDQPPAAGASPMLGGGGVAAAAPPGAGFDAGGGGVRVSGGRPPPELQGLKRLVEDVFRDDVTGGFRDYCLEEPGWAPAVAFLDETDRGGWQLIQALVDCHTTEALGRVTAQGLLELPWLKPGGR